MSYPAPPPASRPESTPATGGFFNDLFDIRFTRFVSLRLISVVYVVILAAVSIVALGVIFSGFSYGVGPGLFLLVLAALGWIIYVVLARVALEAFAVLFRIHDDTSRMAEGLGGSRAPVAGYDPPSGGYGATQPYGGQSFGQGPGATPPPPPGRSAPGSTPGSAPDDPSDPPWS